MHSSLLAILSAVGVLAAAHDPLTGTIIAAQLRCQGYLCPQWALDISRYDTIRYPQEPFEYNLQEALPLAPTSQRSFHTYTAYDDATREFNLMATDYPVAGVDAFWVSDVNDAADGMTPNTEYVLVPHPGTSANSGAKGTVARFMLAPSTSKGGRKIVIFRDGCIFDVDLATQTYTKIVSLFDGIADAGVYDVTDAHVFDGSILKSFIIDGQGVSYLVHVDFSAATPVVSSPVAIVPLTKSYVNMRPIGAQMVSMYDGDSTHLCLIMTGNFDTITFVDEVTGEQPTILTSNLYNDAKSIFMCDEDLKECDMWRNSAFDPVDHALYLQMHVDDGNNGFTNTMAKVGFTQNKVSGIWYAYINPVQSPMNFGYSGYQYASIKA